MKSPQKLMSWTVWFLVSLFYAYQYVLRILPSITLQEIMGRFAVDASLFGQFSGIYYLGYAGMHVPLGIMLDRIGPKKILPLAVFFTLLGLLPLIFSNSWILACVGRLAIGMGSSAAILGVFKVTRMMFPEEKFGRMLGLSVTIGLAGAIYGSQPLNYLLMMFGWEKVLSFLVVLGGVLGSLLYILVPHETQKIVSQRNIFKDIKHIFTTPNIVLICLCAGLMVGPLEGFADVWGTSFLMTVFSFKKEIAATLPSVIFIGMGIGSPLLAILAEKTKLYEEIIIGCALVMTFAFSLVLLGVGTYSTLFLLFILIGIASAYQILAIYKASTHAPEALMGLTTAIANMIIMAFGYLFHFIIGQLMDATWDEGINQGIRTYQADAFITSLAIIPVALVMGGLGFMITRRRTRNSLSRSKS